MALRQSTLRRCKVRAAGKSALTLGHASVVRFAGGYLAGARSVAVHAKPHLERMTVHQGALGVCSATQSFRRLWRRVSGGGLVDGTRRNGSSGLFSRIRPESIQEGNPLIGDDMAASQSNDLLTPAEVAVLFRVNPKTVTRWARAGKISAIRTLGGHRRFRRDEIEAVLHSEGALEL